MMFQHELVVATPGRGLHDITAEVQAYAGKSRLQIGLCQLFCKHTSASLIIQENADPNVLVDLETWMTGAVQDGDLRFRHTEEGPDDMSGHVRSVLTQPSLLIPIRKARLSLGTWQAIYLWEHRYSPHSRRIVLTMWGEGSPAPS